MQAILGRKIDQSQRFLEDGTRVPVTEIDVQDNPVVNVRTIEKNNYAAVQLGFGTAKKATKSLQGQAKQAKLSHTPRFLREVRLIDGDTAPTIGDLVKVDDVLKPGDIIQVTGVSKGKGWAGGVKRHHFKGGPRTHGQSDRERAPGSIGQTTTPGRVYKGKRMAGRMGHEQVTVKNLKVVDIDGTTLIVAGLVPGSANNLLLIQKTGEMKSFVPLYRTEEEKAAETSVEEVAQVVDAQPEAKADEAPVAVKAEESVETVDAKADEQPAPQEKTTEEAVEAQAPADEVKEEAQEGNSDPSASSGQEKEEKEDAK